MKIFQSKLMTILRSIFVTLVIIVAIVVLLFGIYMMVAFGLPKSYDTTSAINAIIIYDRPHLSFEKEISKEDLAALKQILDRGSAWHDSPACPFGDVCLLFSDSSKELSLYPAGDDCNLIAFGYKGKTYYFGAKTDDDYSKLKAILEKYGVVWPHSV